MSIGHGPKIVSDGLIFAYDMEENIGYNKSWKGKPTTNLIATDLTGYTKDNGCTVTATGEYFQGSPVYRVVFNFGTLPRIRTNFAYTAQQYNGSIYYKVVTQGSHYAALYFREINFGTSYVSSTLNSTSWTRANINYTFSASGTAMFLLYQANSNSTSDTVIDFAMPQSEVGSYATPYVSGTRSNTQALLDWTGNHTITANSLVYNSDNSFSFNGSNTYMYNSVPSQFLTAENTTDRTWEVWVKPASVQTNAGLFGHKVTAGCSYYCNGGIYINSTQYSANWYDNAAYQWLGSGVAPVANTWAHVVVTWDSVDLKFRIYVNGVLKATSSATNNNYSTGNVVYDIGFNSKSQFGGGGASDHFNGDIGVVRYYYNKTLTADEIEQNFNAMRGRFGL